MKLVRHSIAILRINLLFALAIFWPLPISAEEVPNFVSDFLAEKNLTGSIVFESGFEQVKDFGGFYIVPQNYNNAASHDLSSDQVYQGKYSHKAWIYSKGARKSNENTNHRAYPTIQLSQTRRGVLDTAAFIDFYAWMDFELSPREGEDWVSLATYTSYEDINWYRSYLVNVDSKYRLHLMHVPKQGESRPDIANNSLVIRRGNWTRISTYIDYTKLNRFESPIIAVWLDGALAVASRFNNRIDPYSIPPKSMPACLKQWDKLTIDGAEHSCGLKFVNGLAQMHFGLYAPPLLSSGTIYNDALKIIEIKRPVKK